MPLVITSQPVGPRFFITGDAQMPAITVTADLKDEPMPAGAAPVYEWSASLVYDGGQDLTWTRYGEKCKMQHRPIASQTGHGASWRIPFTEVRGGLLKVQVTARFGKVTRSASVAWTVEGSNPTHTALRAFATSIGADKVTFRKKMVQESSLRQFVLTTGKDSVKREWPNFSQDGAGGVGLCQLTTPPPSADQVWNWKANVRGGWQLFKEKEGIARSYMRKMKTSKSFVDLVAAWNKARVEKGLKPATVTLPDFTAKQLELDALRGFNGFANGLHEYRVRLQDGMLFVTLDPGGTTGKAEWEQVPVAERGTKGDPNYVRNVLDKKDF